MKVSMLECWIKVVFVCLDRLCLSLGHGGTGFLLEAGDQTSKSSLALHVLPQRLAGITAMPLICDASGEPARCRLSVIACPYAHTRMHDKEGDIGPTHRHRSERPVHQ